jgi:hypothetical protein
METVATRGMEYSAERVLYLALELGNKKWKLGFSTGLGQAPRIRDMPAGDLGALQEEIHLAKERFGLPEETKTLSCLPGGRQAMRLAETAFGWPGTWPKRGSRIWWWIPRASSLPVGRQGEPAAQTGQDGPHGCDKAGHHADPVPQWRSQGVARCARSERGS